MPDPVRFQDILLAFEFIDASPNGGNQAFICRETGKIHWKSELYEDEELPPDLEEDREHYVEMPHKRNLGLGKSLVLAFAREVLPDDFDEIRFIFSRKGAYPTFRALLARRNAIDRWHAFEDAATERALRDWCKANGVILSD